MKGLTILTLEKWLSFFESPIINSTTFVETSRVWRKEVLFPLKDLIGNKLTDENVKLLYKISVIDKELYLINFYNNNLKIPEDISMSKFDTTSVNNNKHPHLKVLVRNLYFQEILWKTEHLKKRSFMSVIIDLFKYNIIDYYLLSPSVMKLCSENNVGSMLSGMYFRASIMNPFVVYALSGSTKKVLTPCLGWSSYLLGFMENKNLEHYVGIDVIKKVCDTTKKLATHFRPDIKCDIYCKPSEDLYRNKPFNLKYKNYFDTVFFCPPYYQLELYEGSDQSTTRYTNYNEWLEKYWKSTIKLCYNCLKEGGELCYIISGYVNPSHKYMDLDTDMNNIIINNKFKLLQTLPMSRNIKFMKKANRFYETIYIFRK